MWTLQNRKKHNFLLGFSRITAKLFHYSNLMQKRKNFQIKPKFYS